MSNVYDSNQLRDKIGRWTVAGNAAWAALWRWYLSLGFEKKGDSIVWR